MDKARQISKSMMSYIKKVRDQKEFLLKETQEFDRSKRHLANMMGLEAQEMSQEDVEDAIKYLFPTGLFDKKAHPQLKPPEMIYEKVKDAQFDEEGRPNHYLFYTVRPSYFEAITQITDWLDELNKYEDEQLAKGFLEPPVGSQYVMFGERWLNKDELASKLLEPLDDFTYNYFIRSATALLEHPYSARAKDFFTKYTNKLMATTRNMFMPPLQKDEHGRTFAEMETRKREHRVKTRVTFDGTGKIDIENKDILYFDSILYRQNIFFPIQISGMQDKIDIESKITFRPKVLGEASVSGAIREAVARSIAAYVDEQTRERMRLAGLLTTDIRVKERKKFGQEGARRKYTWKKR